MSETLTTPLVSVLITVRNAEAFITATMASILQEKQIPLEVVVVDNGCTDATVDRVLAFQDDRVRVVPGPKKGIAHALNVAYAEARGQIIMRCDGDDLFPPQRIAEQVKWLQDHPEFGAVCGGFSTMDSKGTPLAKLSCDQKSEEITEELCSGKTRTHIGTFAMRAEAVKAAGYSREYFDCFEDIDFQYRLGEACRVWFVPEVMYEYRLHSTSVTHSQSNTLRQFYDATALEFQKQRRTRGSDDLQRGCPPAIPQGGDKVGMNASEHVQGMLLGSAWMEHAAGRKQQALLMGLRSVVAQPANWNAWRSLVALALKPAGKGQTT